MRSFYRELFEWIGVRPEVGTAQKLDRYADWLISEAIPAGGIGPREADRVLTRHIGDSLVFAQAWRDDMAPNELIDIGSGAGLPGIPLAILYPDCQVTLLDRGGRRIRLLERATRVLKLENVSIEDRDAQTLDELWRTITFRGSLRLESAADLITKCLMPTGVAVFGYSTKPEPPPVPGLEGLQIELVEGPTEILGHSAWLLNIRKDGTQ